MQISLGVYSLERPQTRSQLPIWCYRRIPSACISRDEHPLNVSDHLLTFVVNIAVAISWCINRLILHPLRNIAVNLTPFQPRSLLVTNWHYHVASGR